MCVELFAACGGAPSGAASGGPSFGSAGASGEAPPLGRLPQDVRPTRYDLSLEIVPERDRFSGTEVISVEMDRPRRVLWLHGRDLDVSDVGVVPDGGEPMRAEWEQVDPDGVAAIRLPVAVGPGRAEIRIVWEAAFDRQLRGLYRVDSGGRPYAFTQFEAISARRAFPCFDEPAFKTPFDVTLAVPADAEAIANTLVEGTEPAADGMKRVRFATTERLPTYLVAWAVGPLDVVDAPPLPPNDVRDRPLPFRGVAARGRGPDLAHALATTGPIVETLERYSAVAYPYDKLDLIAVPDFAAGAMENAGAITFREGLLLVDGRTAPEDQLRGLEAVVAHELAHMWFGDLVTMPWWDDIWLNEAFASWMGARVIDVLHPEWRVGVATVARANGAMDADSLLSARRIRQPIETPHDIHNAFDAITYSKGASVLAMFERWLGEDVFRAGVRLYLERHAFATATADDLLEALSEASGRDVAGPFRTFLEQPGVPLIAVEPSCAAGPDGPALRQSRYLPVGSAGDTDRAWIVPVCVRYGAGDGAREACALLDGAAGSLPAAGGCADWFMPNADGAGYYRWSLPPEHLARLLRDGWAHLSARERLSVADSLAAAFAGATLPAADLLAALPILADDEERVVAASPMPLVGFVRDRLADDALRPRVEAFARRLYAARFERLGWESEAGEDGERKLLRQAVIGFLAFVGQDPEVRREAARRGREYAGFGSDGALHPEVVSADLAGISLAVAVQDGDAALFDALVARLHASDDAVVRFRILRALGSTHDPALAARALGLALDPLLRVNEVFATIDAQFGEREVRDAAWAWVEDRFDDLVDRVGEDGAGRVPWLAARFCGPERSDEVETFLRPRVEALSGGPRNLAGALETIRLCAARVEAQGPSARAFFESAR